MTDFSDPSIYLPVLLGIVATILSGFALWRQSQDRRVSKATFDLLRTMRREIRNPQTGGTDTKAQQELRKRDALEWRKLTDVAKAIGWVWERMNEDDEE